jgi:hypothetical protein
MKLRLVAIELVRARRVVGVSGLVVLAAGIAPLPSCGGSSGGSKEVCTPGETAACICSNGSSGAQSCAADGTQYGACTCSSVGTGGATTSTGGTSGTGGSAGAASGTGGILGTGGTLSSCATTRACGTACCGTDEVCIVKDGVTRCAPSCTTSSDCAAAAHCCSLLAPANGGSPPAKGACTNDTAACRCTTGSQCQSGSCSPALSTGGRRLSESARARRTMDRLTTVATVSYPALATPAVCTTRTETTSAP